MIDFAESFLSWFVLAIMPSADFAAMASYLGSIDYYNEF